MRIKVEHDWWKNWCPCWSWPHLFLFSVLLLVFFIWYTYKRRKSSKDTASLDNSTQRSSASFETLQLHTPSFKSSEMLCKLQESSQKDAVSVIKLASTSTDCDVHLNVYSEQQHHELKSKIVNLPAMTTPRDTCLKLSKCDACCKGQCSLSSCQQTLQSSAGNDGFDATKFERRGICPSSSCMKYQQLDRRSPMSSFQDNITSVELQSPADFVADDDHSLLPCTCSLQNINPAITGKSKEFYYLELIIFIPNKVMVSVFSYNYSSHYTSRRM